MIHKHRDCIMAWASGLLIQMKVQDEWVDIDRPSWEEDVEYRVKPIGGTAWSMAMRNPDDSIQLANLRVRCDPLNNDEILISVSRAEHKDGPCWKITVDTYDSPEYTSRTTVYVGLPKGNK